VITRRDLIASLAALAAWPCAVYGQSQLPVIGYLSTLSEDQATHMLAAFRAGLDDGGYVEGRNVELDLAGQTAISSGFMEWLASWLNARHV
jgi:hypothetical protein